MLLEIRGENIAIYVIYNLLMFFCESQRISVLIKLIYSLPKNPLHKLKHQRESEPSKLRFNMNKPKFAAINLVSDIYIFIPVDNGICNKKNKGSVPPRIV